MKNQLFSLLLSCLFLLGTSSISSANELVLEGGVDLVVDNVKTGSVLCMFSVSDQYLDEDGALLAPLVVSLVDNKITVYAVTSESLQVTLPDELSGTYTIRVQVGDFLFEQKITL